MAQELHGRSIGGWRAGDLLGSGGSALVLGAEREGRQAALKIIDPELEDKHGASKQEKRIGYELKLVGRRHPHLVEIYDGGRCRETSLLFIAMEKLPYRNLDEVSNEFPASKLLQVTDQIAQAAQFLEQLGICHRDIKPENIAITDDFERAILLDLGILRPLDPQITEDAGTGQSFIGTVRYSPPEFVWRREEKTEQGYRAITFYQIGGVLHDLIMRRRLFDHVPGPLAALINSVTNELPVVAAQDVDQRLINLVRDCLQKDWRARLRLIDWNSFTIGAEEKADARERVRAVLASSKAGQAGSMDSKTPDRATLASVGRTLRDQVRAVCLKNSDFPRAAIDYNAVSGRTEVTVVFEASSAHQLQGGARLTISAAAVGGEMPLYAVDAAGSWGELLAEPNWKRLTILRSAHDDLSEVFETVLYNLIANAMANPAPDDGTAIPLE